MLIKVYLIFKTGWLLLSLLLLLLLLLLLSLVSQTALIEVQLVSDPQRMTRDLSLPYQ